MKIISWNVNGLRNAIRQGFWEWFAQELPDILCLQEIKAKASQLPLEEFKRLGYETYISDAIKPGYAGTLVASKIGAEEQNCLLGIDRFDHEGRMMELTFPDLTLINYYLPHGGRQKENLTYKLSCYDRVTEYCRGRENLILAGDFNIAFSEIDLARPTQNKKNIMFTPQERSSFKRLFDIGLADSYRFLFPKAEGAYTWWPYMASARARNIGWRIDYILVSNNLKQSIIGAGIMKEVSGSDHCPIYIDLL